MNVLKFKLFLFSPISITFHSCEIKKAFSYDNLSFEADNNADLEHNGKFLPRFQSFAFKIGSFKPKQRERGEREKERDGETERGKRETESREKERDRESRETERRETERRKTERQRDERHRDRYTE